MRELKFRAWNKNTKTMFYPGNPLMPDITASGCPIGPHTRQNLSMDYEIEQSLGVVDKNLREIYEGDIIKGTSANYLISFHPETCRYYGINKIKHFEIAPQRMANHEIIGNVHSNPELLQ